jgi:hypothetical protein
MKTNEEIGAEAAKIARKKVLEQARQVKLTTRRILTRISEGLDATEVKTNYDKDRGKWSYSEPLIDHGHRLEAAGMGIIIHDMKPCEKKKIDVNHSGSIMAAVASHLSQPVQKAVKEDKSTVKKSQPKQS